MRIDQPFFGDAGRVFTERHVRDIEQPAGGQVARNLSELVFEEIDRLARPILVPVDRVAPQREQARVHVVFGAAIVCLADPHFRLHPQHPNRLPLLWREGNAALCHALLDFVEAREHLGVPSVREQFFRQHKLQRHCHFPIRCLFEPLPQHLHAPIVGSIGDQARMHFVRQTLEPSRHPCCALGPRVC